MATFFLDDSFHSAHNTNLLNNGIIDGDVDLSDRSATAVGTGAVAGSSGATVNAATGAGSVANLGGEVNQAFGQGQVISHSSVGQNAFNSPGAIQADHGASGAFNTGSVVGVQSGGPAIGNVVGDHNQTATVLGHADGSAFGLGDSTVGAASGNHLGGDGSISGLGNSQTQSHNTLDHGSALGGHDAFGSNVQDESTHLTETNLTHIDHSANVATASGHSFTEAHQHFHPVHVEVDHSQVAGDDISSFFHG